MNEICPLRKVALKLFGPKIGWKLNKAFPISAAIYFFGFGVAVHDFFVECANPLRYPPHGFWYGVSAMTIGFVLAYYQICLALKK